MFGSAILETVIGSVFVFLVMSTVVSSLSEQFSTIIGLRPRVLRLLIQRLFGGEGEPLPETGSFFGGLKRRVSGVFRRIVFGIGPPRYYPEFETNPLIKSFKKTDGSFPSYLPPETVAEVVIDILDGDLAHQAVSEEHGTLDASREMACLREAFAAYSQENSERPACFSEEALGKLRLMFHRSQSSAPEVGLATFKKEIANWFDRGTDRASGWYKIAINRCNVIMALLLVVAINIDSLALINAIYTQPETRQSLADSATQMTAVDRVAEDLQGDDAEALRDRITDVEAQIDNLQGTGLPIGWSERLRTLEVTSTADWLTMILGWLISIFAISLGAPFWFDLLNKLVNLRNAGKKGETPEVTAPTKGTGTSEEGTRTISSAPVETRGAGSAPREKKKETLPPGFWSQAARKNDFETLSNRTDPNRDARILALAEAAALSYRDKKTIEEVLGKAWTGMDTFAFLDAGKSTQGFYAKNKSDLLVCFRGTEQKLNDFIADARFRLEPFSDGWGEVHRGFCDALDEIYGDQLLPEVEAMAEDPDLKIFLAGHSLGAALATLCAARFAKKGLTEKIEMLATFGSPRCGNEAYRDEFEKALGDKTYRVVNDEDLVTRVPMRAMGYFHVGLTRFINTDGRVTDLNGWLRFLSSLVNAADDFKEEGSESIADHAIAGYILRWQNWISRG